MKESRTNLEKVTLALRERILSGAVSPGSRVREAALADEMGVSRTPVRLALNILEQEGLLVGESRKGFHVRAFSLTDVLDAIEVRGALEGLAARGIVEKGNADRIMPVLQACLTEEDAILAKGVFQEADTGDWKAINSRFHNAIVEGCRNDALARAVRANDAIPLAAAGAIAFNTTLPDLGFLQLRATHEDHIRISDAIGSGEGARAESLMIEHARRSRDNKKQTFSDMAARRHLEELPGAVLVLPD